MMKVKLGLMLVVGVLLTGCINDTSEIAKQSAKRMESVNALMEGQPGAEIAFSMDRYILDQRNIRLNDPNKMTYLYVILPDGNWLKVTIIGKLTSTTKRLTRTESLQCSGGSGSTICDYTAAPDEMGVWGESTPAKTGMTTLGSLLEIGGFLAYVYSETPLSFSTMGEKVKMVELTVELTAEERQEFKERLDQLKAQARR